MPLDLTYKYDDVEIPYRPAFYAPWQCGRYEIKAGLNDLKTDFGNSFHDSRIFQIDNTYHHYRQKKLNTLIDNRAQHEFSHECDMDTTRHICKYIVRRLCDEYPEYFNIKLHNTYLNLHNEITGDVLTFSHQWDYIQRDSITAEYSYHNGLDALSCQIQEDISITNISADNSDYISYLHLCFPNHWAPANKIGTSFIDAHQEVPGMETIKRNYRSLLGNILNDRLYVRFAWGLASTPELNCLPGHTLARTYADDRGDIYVRTERQVLKGFCDIGSILFTIRTYITNINELDSTQKSSLRKAILGMSRQELDYKGLAIDKNLILDSIN